PRQRAGNGQTRGKSAARGEAHEVGDVRREQVLKRDLLRAVGLLNGQCRRGVEVSGSVDDLNAGASERRAEVDSGGVDVAGRHQVVDLEVDVVGGDRSRIAQEVVEVDAEPGVEVEADVYGQVCRPHERDAERSGLVAQVERQVLREMRVQ